MSKARQLVLFVLLMAVIFVSAVAFLNFRGEDAIDEKGSGASGSSVNGAASASTERIERGRYLALAGNCVSCHTTRGGVPYAGGRGIETPFGTVFAPNLTPDREHGLGQWTSAHFWRAMHNGRSKDGRLLYPAFPYPNYTSVTREDSDAMFAYLQSLPAAAQPNLEHTLRVPFNTQAALAVWRALFFKPGSYDFQAARSAEWNRGAYLVQGLGHCNACHASRNAFGATAGTLDLNGGLIPVQNWYAPSLTTKSEASVADWPLDDIVKLLQTGVSYTHAGDASVLGPMGEVVQRSTQFLNEPDLKAMATYLKELPVSQEDPAPPSRSHDTSTAQVGARLYDKHCAQCHGDQVEGTPGAYPRLAGNRSVTMNPPANLVRIVVAGGFPPATAGNPRPYGMQPFASVLNNDEIAAVATFIRSSWGNEGTPVSAVEVSRYRAGTPY